MQYLWGIMGIIVVLGIAFAFSTNKKRINFRTVLGGLAIQLFFAFIVLETSWGQNSLKGLTQVVNAIINYSNEGIKIGRAHV